MSQDFVDKLLEAVAALQSATHNMPDEVDVDTTKLILAEHLLLDVMVQTEMNLLEDEEESDGDL